MGVRFDLGTTIVPLLAPSIQRLSEQAASISAISLLVVLLSVVSQPAVLEQSISELLEQFTSVLSK